MKIKNVKTGEIAYAQRWNLHAMSEIVVGYPGNGMDSDYSKNWVCACHSLPLSEDPNGYGQVLCKLEADKQLKEARR